MKKFTTLMATSAAVLGLAGSLTAVNADAISDLQDTINNSTYTSQSGSNRFKDSDDWSADSVRVYKDGQTILQASNALKQDPNLDVNDALSQNPFTNLRGLGKDVEAKKADTCNTIEKDKLQDDAVNGGSAYTNRVNDLAARDIAAVNELYSNNTKNATSSSSKADNDVKAPAQNSTTSSSSSKANNDVKVPAQNSTTSNSSKTNNGVKAAAQNTTANGAVENNNENTKAAGKTTTADTQQANNNGTVSTTAQNSNANAVSISAEMHQAAQKATTNTTAVPTMPQTGEQGSEILAIAGGLVIAATAAGIVVYKKRN